MFVGVVMCLVTLSVIVDEALVEGTVVIDEINNSKWFYSVIITSNI